MFEHFTPAHLPMLFIATTQALGGLIPIPFPTRAILDFGLPARIADSPPAHPVMVIGGARTTTIGLILWTFYAQGKLVEFDTVLGIFGSWVGLVDGLVCWNEGKRGKGVFRALSGAVVAFWGVKGLTSYFAN
ncbi:hypothetical protein BJX66DRAFT_337358 [Aspergillus keveii]|jgi:hypothetical protein|uniref:Integral membrane protein n=1 Tax=Aspergillus keveii TaxID=714993 RepID=A0ABR4G8C3_9EURO